jgi:hypothetical protein
MFRAKAEKLSIKSCIHSSSNSSKYLEALLRGSFIIIDVKCMSFYLKTKVNKKAVAAVLLFFLLFFDAFAAPLRYYLSLIGLEVIIYLPKFACLLFVVSESLHIHVNKKLIQLLTLLLFFAVIGFLYYTTVSSAFFTIFLISPLLFGIVVAKYIRLNESGFVLIILFIFILTAVGVYLDIFIDYPWKGYSYNIGNAEIEGSREWETFGVDRLAGFARVSAVAAFYLLCTGLFLHHYVKYRSIKFVVWLFAFFAIFQTTNKAAVAAFIFASISIVLYKQPLIRAFYVWGWVFLLFLLPFSTLFIKYDINLSDDISLMLLASFDDRLINTWPNFISAISESGNYILGTGFGGCGSGSKYFNTSEMSSLEVADNLALYLYGWFGGLSVFVLFYIARITLYLFKHTDRLINSFGPVMVALLAASITTDVIEAQIFSLILGISIGFAGFPDIKKPSNQNSAKRSSEIDSVVKQGTTLNSHTVAT